MSPRRTDENAAATRRALMDAGRELFATRGYAHAPSEVIAHQAGVTRGALYHHFENKEMLFQAVFEEVAQDIVHRAQKGTDASADPWERLCGRIQGLLDACTDPAVVRIAFIDAPSVLGWERWRQLDAEQGLKIVRDALQAAMDEGTISGEPVTALSHIVVGAVDEAALFVARASDRPAARAEVGAILNRVLGGLRSPA